MSDIDKLFDRLKAAKQKAFMPFVTAGDPDLDFTIDVVKKLVASGSSMCELGIPYSDPIADGPTIQASYTRALHKKTKLDDVFRMIKRLTPDLEAPIVTMVSYSIVYRHGLDSYVSRAKSAGVSGLIVPDLSLEDSDELSNICRQEDISLIRLITPTTPHDRALRIIEKTTGFIYYVSVSGVTGERQELPQQILDNVEWLRDQTSTPVCIGFGISRPEHVRMLAPVSDGLIVGSAIVRRMAEVSEHPREEILTQIGNYVAELLDAMK